MYLQETIIICSYLYEEDCLMLEQLVANNFGPSGVHALPLAAGINEGGHYVAYFVPLLFFLPPLFKTTEGVVVLFQIFAWAPN